MKVEVEVGVEKCKTLAKRSLIANQRLCTIILEFQYVFCSLCLIFRVILEGRPGLLWGEEESRRGCEGKGVGGSMCTCFMMVSLTAGGGANIMILCLCKL